MVSIRGKLLNPETYIHSLGRYGFVFNRAQELAEVITHAPSVHIVTHIDADGITAGAIAVETLKRLQIPSTIECVKQLDESIMKRLVKEKHDLIWFTDLGSSVIQDYPTLNMVVTDHHKCSESTNTPFHLNPHLYGKDGAFEISGAGTTYLVSKAIDIKNTKLSALAIVGACGDIQERRERRLTGMNTTIVQDGVDAGVVQVKKDIRFFGRETRPVSKLLLYANDPVIPGLTGREDGCTSFLQDLDIPLKEGEQWRRWIDLDHQERQRILSALAKLLLVKGFGSKHVERIIGDVYLLSKEKKGTELHDAKEYATLLNATARYGKQEVGLHICLGERSPWLKEAQNLLRGHRQNLVEGLQYAREEKIQKRQYVQFFHAGEGIRDTIIGIVTNMLLNSEDVDARLPLIGFAQTENGDVKVSARTTQALVEKGVDLSLALKKAAASVNGVGGGHNIAAGATIPKGSEQKFLDALEHELKHQCSF